MTRVDPAFADLTGPLIRAGFTMYEARVYLALLSRYPVTGYHISRASGVPRSMVYEALGRLETRGAVLKSGERRGTLYRPVAPDLLLDRYEQEQRRLFRELRGRLGPLYVRQDEELVWTIRGRDTVLAHADRLIAEARREVLVVLADPELQALRDSLARARKRKITVGAVLTGQGTLEVGQVVRHPPLESRMQELVDMLVLVADGRQAVIATTGHESVATATSNRHLAVIARQFVWMELFAHRISARIGPALLGRLDPEDRRILTSHIRPRAKSRKAG